MDERDAHEPGFPYRLIFRITLALILLFWLILILKVGGVIDIPDTGSVLYRTEVFYLPVIIAITAWLAFIGGWSELENGVINAPSRSVVIGYGAVAVSWTIFFIWLINFLLNQGFS